MSGGGTPSAGQSITIGRWAMTVKFRSDTSSSLIFGGTVSQSTKNHIKIRKYSFSNWSFFKIKSKIRL